MHLASILIISNSAPPSAASRRGCSYPSSTPRCLRRQQAFSYIKPSMHPSRLLHNTANNSLQHIIALESLTVFFSNLIIKLTTISVMTASERIQNMSGPWRIFNGGKHSRNPHKVGHATSEQMNANERRHDTENSEINGLKEKIAMQEKRIEWLEKMVQEMLAKLNGVEQAANQQTAQSAQVVRRLEEEVAKLGRGAQEKTTTLHNMVNTGDARRANRVQKSESSAAVLVHSPRDMVAKLPNTEGTVSRPNKRPALTLERLETKVIVLESPTQERTPVLFSPGGALGQRDQKMHDSNQKLFPVTEGERTNKHLPRAPVRADSISVAEIAEMVRVLNAQVEQTSILVVDSLSYQRPPTSGRGSRVVSNELRDYLGSRLCRDLQRRSNEPDAEPDQLITQIVIQTGLINACSRIVNGWTPPDISQGSADTRKARNQDVHNKYLTTVLLELINAVGGSLQSGEQLPSEYQDKIEDIANKAVRLHRIINEEVTSSELVTYTIPCGAKFDSSLMEDTEGDGGEGGSTPHDSVVCAIEMGLQCRKKVEPVKARQQYVVSMKAKVVLASMLEA